MHPAERPRLTEVHDFIGAIERSLWEPELYMTVEYEIALDDDDEHDDLGPALGRAICPDASRRPRGKRRAIRIAPTKIWGSGRQGDRAARPR